MNKFRQGKIKREHSIIPGLLPLLEALAECPHVQTVIPGPIGPGATSRGRELTFQYFTDTGLKLLGKNGDAIQEVFLVSADKDGTRVWLQAEGLIAPDPEPQPSTRKQAQAVRAFEVLMHDLPCDKCGRPILAGTRAARLGPPKRPTYAHVRCARG